MFPIVLVIWLNIPIQLAPCDVYGTVYEVEYPSQADYFVYESGSEAFADVIVYEETNRLYADKKGKWFFAKKPGLARHKIYFVDKKSQADFSVYFTQFESFAGCNQ